MNILVCLKQTFDTEAKVVLKQDRIDSEGVKLIVNPYDEYAIEEGIRLKEKFGGEVTVISLGGPAVEEALRSALAMGADKAIAVVDPQVENLDEHAVAFVLYWVISGLQYDLILAGRIAIDSGSSQVPVRLAELLNLPSVSGVIRLGTDGSQAIVTRDNDGGTETLELLLPAVITTQRGLNDPRYATVMGIMKAKKKELKTLTLADLGLTMEQLPTGMKVVEIKMAETRKTGRLIQGEAPVVVADLINALKNEAKVI